MRIGVVVTLCALAACEPAPRTGLELLAAERRGELRLRLTNPGPDAVELEGYRNRGRFHLDWYSRSIQCAGTSTPDAWQRASEPLVDGAFTGVRLSIEAGGSREIIVNHRVRVGDASEMCRVSIRLEDGTELVSGPFPARRLDGV